MLIFAVVLTALAIALGVGTAGVVVIEAAQGRSAGHLAPVARGSGDPTPQPTAADPSATPSGAAPSASASASAVRSTPPQPPPPSPEALVLNLVNLERARAGCRPVTADTRLAAAARGHSADMARRDFFDHTNPDGLDPGRRITVAGYRWSTYGENIAVGYPDARAVMKGWMNSTGHRHNILDCRFRNLGVGLAYNVRHYPYWTQDFGTPA